MAKPSAANIQTLARLDELHAELIAQADRIAALNISDVRDTVHDIANKIVAIADALPAIIARIEEIARWVAEATEHAQPPTESPAATKPVVSTANPKTAKKPVVSKANP